MPDIWRLEVESLATRAAGALFAGLDFNFFNRRQYTPRGASPAGVGPIHRSSRHTGLICALAPHLTAANLFFVALAAVFAPQARAQFGFHKPAASPAATSGVTDDGLPTRVVYHDQKYLVTAGPGGITYNVAIEGNPAPIGMVIKAPNSPVKYRALDNTLETAETIKAVYAVFLKHPGTSEATTGSDSVTVTSSDPNKKEATVQTSAGPISFTNSLNDFDLIIGANPVHGHFSDGSTAGQKAGHVLKSLGRSVSTFGMDSKQMYAGSVMEFSMNHGPKSAFGEDGKAKDIGTSGGANAAGIVAYHLWVDPSRFGKPE
jgi:hypothetical protein